jgi:lactobin A/cerein 7B family class IIb bacteriocin
MKNLSLNQMENVEGGAFNWGCAWSSVGLAAAVVGFAFVTGGTSLVIGLVGYAAGVGGVTTSC